MEIDFLVMLFATLLTLLVVIIMVLVFWTKTKIKTIYKKKSFILSPAENAFFKVLKISVGNRFYICPKVRLADIFEVGPTNNEGRFMSNFRKISQKHVDFLVCDLEDMRPKLAIELDDSSHLEKAVLNRDRFVNKLYEESELPLLRVRASLKYSTETIKKDIARLLSQENES